MILYDRIVTDYVVGRPVAATTLKTQGPCFNSVCHATVALVPDQLTWMPDRMARPPMRQNRLNDTQCSRNHGAECFEGTASFGAVSGRGCIPIPLKNDGVK